MGSSSSFSSAARRQAAHILSQPPFTSKPSHIPDPLGGVLRTVGRWLTEALGKPVAWAWDHVFKGFQDTFGSIGDVVLAILGVGLGCLAAWMLIRRRTRVRSRETKDSRMPVREDVAQLEAAAAAAEELGDLDAAVRLRFRAGLFRLETAGIIASRLVTTTEEVRARLHDATFDDLARRHETIVYAGRTASDRDVVEAREGWQRLIVEVRRLGGSGNERAATGRTDQGSPSSRRGAP
ncbi:MAG: hypothetical protein ACLQNG_12095 [Acidimicrobiales bacterium]